VNIDSGCRLPAASSALRMRREPRRGPSEQQRNHSPRGAPLLEGREPRGEV